MLFKLARFLQFVALLILPASIAGEAAGKLTLKESLILSSAGCLCFFIGWSMQQGSKP